MFAPTFIVLQQNRFIFLQIKQIIHTDTMNTVFPVFYPLLTVDRAVSVDLVLEDGEL